LKKTAPAGRLLRGVLFAACAALAGAGCLLLTTCRIAGPVRIGVLLPLTGSSELGYRKPLEWARDNINAAGGIGGRPIELVYADIGKTDCQEAAQRFLDDATVAAVIGTDTSSATFDIAPKFIKAQKVLVSPAATSADIFRAFAGKKYIWRTVESDIAQMRVMFLVAARAMHKKVAMITATDTYGTTFFDWFGFFATELGMEPTALVRYDQSAESCEDAMEEALAGSPDMLFASPSDPETAICMARQMAKTGGDTKLLFTDGGTYTSIIETLGEEAEGLRGMALSFDPLSGFNYAYYKQFDEQPSAYAANTYDALCLIAYGLQRSGGQGGEELADAMMEVVDARGQTTIWDGDGIREAMRLIRSGELPDITGATGNLSYDALKHTDVTGSTYCLWEVEQEQYVCQEYIYSGSDEAATTASALSIFETLASEQLKQDLSSYDTTYDPPDKQGLWALLLSPSAGWNNYRHQADALAVYSLLKQNGLPDSRIILIINDDLAESSQNPLPGDIHYVPGGSNLYTGVEVDYHPRDLLPQDIYDILAGKTGGQLPSVIEAGEADNIFVFIVGHGDTSGSIFNDAHLTPEGLADALSLRHNAGGYRRVLVEVETCHGGLMGTGLDSPGVLLMAGANPWENSFAANYDGDINQWLADQFAYAMYQAMTETPGISLYDLYETVYLQVNGSHVSVYNYELFGNTSDIFLKEFIEP